MQSHRGIRAGVAHPNGMRREILNHDLGPILARATRDRRSTPMFSMHTTPGNREGMLVRTGDKGFVFTVSFHVATRQLCVHGVQNLGL